MAWPVTRQGRPFIFLNLLITEAITFACVNAELQVPMLLHNMSAVNVCVSQTSNLMSIVTQSGY